MKLPVIFRRSIYSLLFFILGNADSIGPSASYQPREGDILFQSLPHGPVIDAIEGATHSPYSHCGILFKKPNGSWYVLEASGPVKETSIRKWRQQGRGGYYDVYRLKPEHRAHIPGMLKAARKYIGRPYDIQYDFDDHKIYCSELIFKAYRDTSHEELGTVRKLGDLDWKPYRQVILSIDPHLPLERKMITPRDLAEAEQLEKVHRGYPAAAASP